MIIDGYGAYEGCKKAVDEFILEKGLRIFLSQVVNSSRYWVKP